MRPTSQFTYITAIEASGNLYASTFRSGKWSYWFEVRNQTSDQVSTLLASSIILALLMMRVMIF